MRGPHVTPQTHAGTAAARVTPQAPWLKKAAVVPSCNYTFVYYNSIIYLFITIAQRLRIRNIYKRWNKDYKYNTDQVYSFVNIQELWLQKWSINIQEHLI
jgi:hypothetical protein